MYKSFGFQDFNSSLVVSLCRDDSGRVWIGGKVGQAELALLSPLDHQLTVIPNI